MQQVTISDYLKEKYGKTINQLRSNINYHKNNQEKNYRDEYIEYCVDNYLKITWYNSITQENLEKLKKRQEQLKLESEGLRSWDITEEIGIEHYFETHGERGYSDTVYIWVDPKSLIIVSCKIHIGNDPMNEETQTTLEQFKDPKSYNDYLFELKTEIEDSEYQLERIKGTFTQMLVPTSSIQALRHLILREVEHKLSKIQTMDTPVRNIAIRQMITSIDTLLADTEADELLRSAGYSQILQKVKERMEDLRDVVCDIETTSYVPSKVASITKDIHTIYRNIYSL